MTRPDRDIPPGHTKPPLRGGAPILGSPRPKIIIDPRSLPRNAQLVLLIAMAVAFGFVLFDPEPMSTVGLAAFISIAAFGEARREDQTKVQTTLSGLYDRAFGHALWIAAAMLPVVFLALGLRSIFGLHEGGVE